MNSEIATTTTLVFMDSNTYEQIELAADFVGERSAFLQDGMTVSVQTHESTPIGIELPEQVTLEVTETEPTIKGQTASSSYKPAVVDNGERVMVPPHIEVGTRIVVHTDDGSYVERAKN